MYKQLNIKSFLEAGVHFGHQTRRWNPKMSPYIFGEKNKIHIIDLKKTLLMAKEATSFVEEAVASGGEVLFVGTKRQAQLSIEQAAARSQSFSVSQRWLGGMLTNFQTVKISVEKMQKIRKMRDENNFGDRTKKEIGSLMKELDKLEKNLKGIENMKELPKAVFIVDPKKEHIALREARKLNIPTIVLIDTNCDPEGIDYLIPGNDDAIRAINLFCNLIADAVDAGRAKRPAKSEAVEVAAEEVSEEQKTETVEANEAPDAVESATEKTEDTSSDSNNS